MENNNILEKLDIEDCFIDSKNKLEIDRINLNKLREEIRITVNKNEQMHNKGISLLILEEKLSSGEISKNTYKKVKKIIK